MLLVAAARPAAAAVPVPAAPQTGDCTSCIGEVNETLNTCNLDTPSCISTLNDDEGHFAAPWMVRATEGLVQQRHAPPLLPRRRRPAPLALSCRRWHAHARQTCFSIITLLLPPRTPLPQFDGDRDAAVARLVEVATGGDYAPGLIDTFGGIRQLDAAGYIAKGVLAVATGERGWALSREGSYAAGQGAAPGPTTCSPLAPLFWAHAGGDMPAQPKRQRKTQGELLPFDGQCEAWGRVLFTCG